MKRFIQGFASALIVVAIALSYITIPEYVVEIKCKEERGLMPPGKPKLNTI